MRPRVARICEDDLHGLGEVSGDAGERGDEEVAEAVAFEVALREAVLEELGEQVLVLGERDHAVADVAGGKHVEVFAQAAGGAAVVGDGDDGGELADEAGRSSAVAGSMRRGDGAGRAWRHKRLSPRSSVERPVPPPMATTRSWRRWWFMRPLLV